MGKPEGSEVPQTRFMFFRVNNFLLFFVGAMFMGLVVSIDGLAQGRVDWDDALDQDPSWYSGDEAIRIADNVLVYQHANGGWPKNINMAQVLSEADEARIKSEQTESGTATTIDNSATFTQMRYLARVYRATGHERFADGTRRGVDYLLDAQYSNGGWPQYYPVREGYYENITFNDGAMIGAMSLLRDIAEGEDLFSFIGSSGRRQAAEAVQKGVELILETQIIQDGERTVWCAQHDPETLEPAWARAYEPPSLSGSESVGIVRFLMSIEEPGPEIIAAVQGAVEWFRSVAIYGYRYEGFTDEEGRGDRRIVADSNAGPLWARFYQLGTNRPIFLGRDSVVRYSMAEIERERRAGYRYYGNWAENLLAEEYPQWRSHNNLSME